MRSNRVHNRFQKAQPTIEAAFAFDDAIVEATRRGLQGDPGPGAMEGAPEQASGEILRLLGRNLRHRLRRMLAVDDHYQELRARQRHRRKQRDAIAQSGHALLVNVRKYLQGFYGWDGACEVLGVWGPTEREPRALHQQLGEGLWWARNWDGMPEPLIAGGEKEAEECLARLEELYSELDEVIDDVGRGDRQVEVAMLDQRAAMAEFDRAYQHGAEAMEAQLIQVGLPTLAAAVRPGVGRRGRPLKQRPVDLHPDLVEQVRADGLVDLELPVSNDVRNEGTSLAASSKDAGDDAARDLASPDAAGDGIEADRRVSNGARNSSADEEIIEQPLPERSEGEEIIEHVFPEWSGSEEESRQPLRERPEDDEKSEHLLHERSGGEEESEQRFHKPDQGAASGVLSRLALRSPLVACAQTPRRRDLERRPGGPAAGRTPLIEVEGPKAPWWQKLLRAS